ncbi:Bromodomain containing protein [Trichomonas vaginalis G3]|uniref:Bromodomain containing protein n=1 Tax=Trichomonas vaginalis (strain ATCC PRA-98 / G3) TaxID=412133 RepID=A2FQC7_TRIV3|nr:chromatin organization [Trichomonas vaginalis G3]EAX92874.1 Bromodomain containing protein [Trichomonas vaginalis G3]KAI5494025.1 chromatin organization [Trichomonas vaginalis G3]|eukprot:XP_001305804.1 Bromodomain containing protein [Trichomonas vaginalis G3]
MENLIRKQLLQALTKIKQRPSAKWFIDPIDTKMKGFNNFKGKLETPMDLTTIERKLKNNKYKTVHEFKKDLDLIWENSQKCCIEDSITSILALDMKQYADNLLMYISDNPQVDWVNKLMFLQEKLSDSVKSINTSSTNNNKRKSTSTLCISNEDDEINPKNGIEFSYEELVKLRKDIESLNGETEKTEIAECIKLREPKLIGRKTTVSLNLGKLEPQTICDLIDKVSELKNKQV